MVEVYYYPRASNALLDVLRNLSASDPIPSKVLFPANECYTFPLAATLSGWELGFYDVDVAGGEAGLIPSSNELLNGNVESPIRIMLVIVIPYGELPSRDLSDLRSRIMNLYQGLADSLSGDAEFHVMWDLALVMPTKELLEGLMEGLGENEFAVFSFSYGKQIELGYGAVLLSGRRLRRTLKYLASPSRISYLIDKVDKRFKGLMGRYGKRLALKLKEDPKVRECYDSALPPSEERVLEKVLDSILSGRDVSLQLRNGQVMAYEELKALKERLNSLYLEAFKGKDVRVLTIDPLAWRFSVRFPSPARRDRFLGELFSRGGFASRLFPVTSRWFGDDTYYEAAADNWLRVVNLFNNHLVDERYLGAVFEAIERTL